MKTEQQYRDQSAANHQEARDSFERCDTDGFVSQHCSGLTGNLNSVKADLVAAGKVFEFVGLYLGDRRVKARIIHTKYGSSWLLDSSETALIEQRGKKFLPTGRNSRILKGLGLREAAELAPAWACLDGSGTGFSGLSSVYVKVFRTGDKWGSDAQLVEEH